MSFYQNIQIRKISLDDPWYAESCKLREQVLMRPIGLSFNEEMASRDADSQHFVATLDGEVVGIVLLVPTADPGIWRLRQMAVQPACQGKGIGRKLVIFAEDWARKQESREIILHARQSAIGFYHSLGYQVRGEQFTEVGIPHRLMFKDLYAPLS